MAMKKMTVGKFKANCAEVLYEIRKARETVLICQGKTVLAEVIPRPVPRKRFFDALRGKMKIVGEIESPLWPTGE
jgi:hypothetical protein